MVQFRACPLEQKSRTIQTIILMFQPYSWISVRMTLRLLGLMASCILLVNHARWHMQTLQWDLKSQ